MVRPNGIRGTVVVVDTSSRECPTCHVEVPAVVLCGACGADLDSPAGRWRALLRLRKYAATPTEAVYVPRMSSTFFPRLPSRATRAYRIALVALLFCMTVMAALQWNVLAAVFSVLAVPVLFMLYAWEDDAFIDDRRRMVASVVLGAVIGIAWWWSTGKLLSDKYGVTVAAAQALQSTLDEGLIVTLIGGALSVLPLPLIRLIPARESSSLDGFVIGAAGALAHMVASYVVWWMPQIVAGLINAQTTSGARMVEDTLTSGVIDPFTTIALGGMVGVSLWFRPDPTDPRRGSARAGVIICTLMTAVLYAALWVVDAQNWPGAVELAINLLFTALAVLTLRVGIQLALLHEKRPSGSGEPILCVYCEKVVPDMAFCPVCGAAALAASRTSRNLRHVSPPAAVTPVAD